MGTKYELGNLPNEDIQMTKNTRQKEGVGGGKEWEIGVSKCKRLYRENV